MPQIGEIKKGRELGRNNNHKYIWQACANCGKERWVVLRKDKPESLRCCKCARATYIVSDETKAKLRQMWKGDKHPCWKGGRHKTKQGYIEVWLSPNSFFYPMAGKKSYVREHRLVMAEHLNRCLLSWEIVHHKNGIRDDNRFENLLLLSARYYHISDTCLKKENKKLREKIKRLEVELNNLRKGNDEENKR